MHRQLVRTISRLGFLILRRDSTLDDPRRLEAATGCNLAQDMAALRDIDARNYVLSLDWHRRRQGDRPDRHGRYLVDQILEDSVDGFACNWHFNPAPARKAAPPIFKVWRRGRDSLGVFGHRLPGTLYLVFLDLAMKILDRFNQWSVTVGIIIGKALVIVLAEAVFDQRLGLGIVGW
jgi:hypothetical protein